MRRFCLVACFALCIFAFGCKSVDQPVLDPTTNPTLSPTASALSSPINSPENSPSAVATQVIKTPEDIVKYYYDRFAAKDAAGVESVLIQKEHGAVYDFDHLISMKLVECNEVQTLSDDQLAHFDALGYKDVFAKSVVKVVFTVEYDDSGYDGGFGPGKSGGPWSFSLVRETESSDWVIVSYGA